MSSKQLEGDYLRVGFRSLWKRFEDSFAPFEVKLKQGDFQWYIAPASPRFWDQCGSGCT